MVKADFSRDYYADLELPPSADVNEIKKQFKKLALKYHPDRNIGRESEVNAKFQNIQSAHEVLTDEAERRRYDQNRVRGKAFGSGFGGGMNAQRGNPYANAGAQWAPPPKRHTATRQTAPPPSAGAAKFKNFETPGAGSYRNPQEGAESRRSTYQAWEKMKQDHGKSAYSAKASARPPPPPPPARDANNSSKPAAPPRTRPAYEEPNPNMRRSQSTKRSGFMPSDPSGDEPPAGSTSSYSTRNRRSQFGAHQNVPSPPPQSRGPPSDPLRQFEREHAGLGNEPRLSTPYSTHGGEKTNPFESANLNRSKSTRERAERSTSPSTSHRPRPKSAGSSVPRPDSDPNLARSQRPSRQSTYKSHFNSPDDDTSSEDELRMYSRTSKRPVAKPRQRKASAAQNATDAHPVNSPPVTSPTNGQPSMYGNHFSSVSPELLKDLRPAKFAAASSTSGRDKYGMASTSSYHAKSSEDHTFQSFMSVPESQSDSYGLSPSGAPANCLNSFELAQRSIISNLVNQPRTNALLNFGMQGFIRGNQPVSAAFSQSNQYSFSFNPNGTNPQPSGQTFASKSTDSINTKFTPEDWHGKFTGSDYFTNEQKAANMPQRTQSGSRSRGRSPTKPWQGSTPSLATQFPASDLNTKADPQTPSESPSGSRFSAQEWASTFKPQTFAPPPHPSPTSKPAFPRKSSRTQRISTVRPTMGSAAVIEDSSDSSGMDGKQLFTGRKAKASETVSSNGSSTHPPTVAASPNAMDIDTEEATPKPTTADPTMDSQSRNVPLEPSRADWRNLAEVNVANAPKSPGPTLPPRAKEPGKRRATKSADSDEFGAISLEDLKNAEPIRAESKGLNGFDDFAANLPFTSQAASRVPIEKSTKTGDLALPKPPKAPRLPQRSTNPRIELSSWEAYLPAFKTYMVDWDLFNCKMMVHFQARRNQVQAFEPSWLEQKSDEKVRKYIEGLTEDKKVREWWGLAADTHEESMKEFMVMRIRVQGLVNHTS
ncbi:hypothetical protein BP6252_04133 [Coleophoma cylindrospora]|uniref:J domain-containing protein n=1 Tax=Coleophoma cylindrospora TaxID=1849047 RepID=A0A3D8RZN0_9HELO|nr:hypothetical protein BP6252_04133 [Coleophoma cylindrospora]